MRHRILSRAAHKLDDRLSSISFRAWMVRSLGSHAPGYKPIQDLAAMRGFIASPTILALFDLPWFPIYLGVIFMLHFKLGLLATAGALVVIILAILNERMTARAASLAAKSELVENRFAEQAQTGADGVVSMGMLGNALGAWRGLHDQSLSETQRASERSGAFTATSKAFRLLLQSAILGLGAYLAIHQEITPGMIVAASIIAGRALAPIDQTIGGWRMIKRARIARVRLAEYLKETTEGAPPNLQLPEPKGHIQLMGVTKNAPNGARTGEGRPILTDLTFALEPGDGLGVIGPSASGKSSLAKLLVGLWMPDQGSVRIDGATGYRSDRPPYRLPSAISYTAFRNHCPEHRALRSRSIERRHRQSGSAGWGP
jgi:ABC-type protease/lipase transport system fused ATPase/permease subunit